MSTDPSGGHVAVLDRWFAAYNAHDVDALCELADPAIEVIPLGNAESIPAGTSYHGHDGLRTMATAGFERYPQLRIERTSESVRGSRISAVLELVLDDGESEPIVREAGCDYQIADGRIRRIRAYEPARDRRRGRAASLSPREREVLTMIAGGRTVAEVADELVLSPLTVRAHIRNAKDKLHARTTPHAIALALDANALDL